MNNYQQPNISPDYNFITSQQVPQNGKKGIDKRIVFIVVCVVLLSIVGLVSLFTSPKKSKTSTTGPAAQQVISFNDALISKDYQKAVELVNTNASDSSQNQSKEELRRIYEQVLDPSTCKVTGVKSDGLVNIVSNQCSMRNNKAYVTYNFNVVKSGDIYMITGRDYEVTLR